MTGADRGAPHEPPSPAFATAPSGLTGGMTLGEAHRRLTTAFREAGWAPAPMPGGWSRPPSTPIRRRSCRGPPERLLSGEQAARLLYGRTASFGSAGVAHRRTPGVLRPHLDASGHTRPAPRHGNAGRGSAAPDGQRPAFRIRRGRARCIRIRTGTGAILIALLKGFPDASGLAVDVSEGALQVAARNARRHGVGDRMQLRQGHWLTGVTGRFHPARFQSALHSEWRDCGTGARGAP